MGNPRNLNLLIYLKSSSASVPYPDNLVNSCEKVLNQQIHNPDSDSSHITSESVNLTNIDLGDYGCEIRLVIKSFGSSFWCCYMFPVLFLNL